VVWGLGVKGQDLRFRIEGLGFGVEGLGFFSVKGLGFGV
jgi:hypothetical protein